MRHQCIYLMMLLPLVGCASTQISSLNDIDKQEIRHICIEHNPKVIVADFENILTKALDHQGITSQIYNLNTPEHCSYILKYTAFQKWDFSMVLTLAELKLFKEGKPLRTATYKLHAGGLLNPTKYKSNESKIFPLVDQLLEK